MLVKNLPYEMPDQVKKVIRVLDSDGLETGDRRVFMDLAFHIPHMAFFDPYFAFVHYKNQPKSCFNCNFWGHTNHQCPLKGHCVLCGRKGRHVCGQRERAVPRPFPVTQAEPHEEEHPALVLIRRKENSNNFDMGFDMRFDDVTSVSSTRTADILEDAQEDPSALGPLSGAVCEVVKEGDALPPTPSPILPILLFSPQTAAESLKAAKNLLDCDGQSHGPTSGSVSSEKCALKPSNPSIDNVFDPPPLFSSFDPSSPSFANILKACKRPGDDPGAHLRLAPCGRGSKSSKTQET